MGRGRGSGAVDIWGDGGDVVQNRESRDFRSQEVGISAHPMVRHPHAMLYLGCQWSASASSFQHDNIDGGDRGGG